MGGGPVMEDVYVPYHWPFSGFQSSSFYGTTSSPLRYYDLDAESALVELIAAFQGWPSCTTMEGNLHEEVSKGLAEGIRNVAGSKSKEGVSDNKTTESLQSEEVVKSVQSDKLEISDKLEEGQKSAQIDEVEKIVQVEHNEKSVRSEKMEKSVQAEEVDNESGSDEERRAATISGKMEKSVQTDEEDIESGSDEERRVATISEKMENSVQTDEEDIESGSDEERRAATMLQARYRGHLVRISRPLVQLRAIAGIQERLKKLKEQVGDGAFLEELRRKESMAKLAFEESTMKLLLQLDNIQGSHPLVRQIRKSVAREIVSLQESVDALLSQGMNTSR